MKTKVSQIEDNQAGGDMTKMAIAEINDE